MSKKYFEFNSNLVHYQYFTGDVSNAVIVLVHGLGEHSGRFEDWARKLNPYNYAVCALDLPGHGWSYGKRGSIRSYSDFYKVLDLFLDHVVSEFPNKPIILYGHSMGGNIVANYVLKRNPSIKAMVLSSPWIKLAVKPNVFQFYLGKLMYKIYPQFHDHTKLNPNYISRLPEEVARYKTDKLVHGRITPALFFPLFYKGIKLLKKANKIAIPTLVFHGSGDKLTSHHASEKFSEGNDKIDFISYRDGYHELHHDLCRDLLLENLLDWLSIHVVMR